MKKIIAICLILTMIASLSLSVFATGGFLSSPSANPAPELIVGENEDEECVAVLTVTAYKDRDQLTTDARQKIEEAYAEIVGTQDIIDLNGAIKKAAETHHVDPEDLAVSDLFDISSSYCQGHHDHGHFDITLEAVFLENFVCLLHYYGGEWHVVEGAEITNNGTHLEFDVDQLSPFAIVVGTIEEPPVDDTVDPVVIAAGAIAAAAALGLFAFLLIILIKKRKKKDEEN